MSTDVLRQLHDSLGDAYTIERELGGGGMSRTYVATERSLSRRVVVKVLAPELVAGVSVDRFKREVLLAARLQHPHIVPVLASGDADGLPWFTMPYVEGESLRTRLARGPLTISEVTGILRDVARALEFAHERGIAHRDIKPDNVLLAGSSATVTDFGIAKAISAARTMTPGATLTMAGMSIGTPAYMAPEQAAGDPTLDHRADIYAFGAMAYELLAGRPPFVATSPARLLAAHLGETPQSIQELRPDVPIALAELVMRCLEKDVRARPQDAAAIVRVLDSVTSSGAAAGAPAAILSAPLNLGRALALWALATALVALTAWAATGTIGLPDWVLPGSLGVMLAGLPAIAFTAWVQRETRRAYTATPTFTPGGTPSAQHPVATLAMKAGPHITWRRTWLGGVAAVSAFTALVIAFMVMRALGIGPVGSLIGKGDFGQREKLVVADFRSPESDSTLGATVAEAIRTDLAQSANLAVLTRAAVREILTLMQRPPATPVDFEVARAIATREGAKGVLDGEIVRLGPSFVVSARLVSSLDGRQLATFRETATSDAELVPVVGRISRDIRELVGESFKNIRDTKPLERVTTSSLPALRKYVEGMVAIETFGDDQRGRELLEEAVALDSTFAMAWRRLAASLNIGGRYRAKQIEAIENAYRYRERLSEGERLLTEAGYWSFGRRLDVDRAIGAYEAMLERDSISTPALNNGAVQYEFKRDLARAEFLLRRAIAVPNPFGGSFGNLVRNQLAQGKIASAESVFHTFQRVLPSNTTHWEARSFILGSKRKFDSVEVLGREVFGSAKNARQREFSSRAVASVSFLGGRLAEGLRWSSTHSSVVASRSQTPAPSVRAALDSAWVAAFYHEDGARAREIVRRTAARVPFDSLPAPDRPWPLLLRIAAATGDVAAARTALANLERDLDEMGFNFPEGARAEARAVAAIASGRMDEAIVNFREADRLLHPFPRSAMIDLARAFDLAGQRDSAIVYFERFIAAPHWEAIDDQWYLAGSYKRLGELYEAANQPLKAIASYEQFVELWKNADPELQPRVKEVRARLERLRADMARRG